MIGRDVTPARIVPRRSTRTLAHLWPCLLLANLVFVAGRASELPPAFDTVLGEHEMVLQVLYKKYLLSDGAEAVAGKAGILLPLSMLASSLDFAIAVDPAGGTARGWFLEESRTFDLDVVRGDARIAGQSHPWSEGAVEVRDDDIYVAAALLSKWFPLRFEFDLAAMTVTVQSDATLPFEAALERERLKNRDAGGDDDTGVLAAVKPEWEAFDWPFADVSLDTLESSDASVEDQHRGSILLAGDLLYMGARGYAAIDGGGRFSDARLRLERRDPDGEALGELGVTDFQVGDLYTEPLPLVADGAAAIGIHLSNEPLRRAAEFDRVDLAGDLPPGWDVELYRNGALLGVQGTTRDGRYAFTSVPLLAGANDLRIVMYGPQGQRREDVRRYFAGPGLVRPGQTLYDFQVGRHESGLVDAGDEVHDEARGVSRVQFAVEQGLTRGISLAAAYARVPAGDAARNYVSAGFRGQVAGVFGRIDLAQDLDRGRAVEASLLTSLGETSFSLRHARYSSFTSEATLRYGAGLTGRTLTRIDAPLALGDTVVTAGFDGGIDRYAGGRRDVVLASSVSTFVAPVSLAHEARWRRIRAGAGIGSRLFEGSLLANGRFGRRDSLRTDLDYEMTPHAAIRDLRASWDHSLRDDLSLRGEVLHAFGRERENGAFVGANWRTRHASFGVSAGYSDRHGAEVSAGVTFGIGREPSSGRWFARAEPVAGSGAVVARAFLDRDSDGRFGAADTPLPGVRFRGTSGSEETDASGAATLPGAGPYQSARISVDPDTLGDPYYVPAVAGYRAQTRPGRVTQIDFPITPTGEVEGVAVMRKSGADLTASNVRLVLMDGADRVVAQTRSAYDGAFLFERVPPGRYRVGVDPDQIARLDMMVRKRPDVELSAAGAVVSGVRLVLERDEFGDLLQQALAEVPASPGG